MRYNSTRDKRVQYSSAKAITQGLSKDGGLLIPAVFPKLSLGVLNSMREMSYQQRAVFIMNSFLEEFSISEITTFVEKAYGQNKFDAWEVAPLRGIDANTCCLELWHGPTCAFKDMALQMLPHLLTAAMKKIQEEKQACILVATSGDTGKAALEGFCDVKRTKIMVFYPKDGVSGIQELQMATQTGSNVNVYAVKGNFDDAQAGVKAIFSDESLEQVLERQGWFLSSANSINWGRILPQIVYYVSAYCDLLRLNGLENGEKINVCVPTGNFGNILSAYYAKCIGVPIDKLICASNQNNVLTEFIHTGVYNRNRPFYNTLSPSMDILISSNLERLLYDMSIKDDLLIRVYMNELASSGRYTVSTMLQQKLRSHFAAGYCDDQATRKKIAEMYQKYHYLIDPHTAVAFDVLDQYRAETDDRTPTVVVSTASPFKFCDSVLRALGVSELKQGTAIINQLEELTGISAPRPLAALKDKTVRFRQTVEKDEMPDVVLRMLES